MNAVRCGFCLVDGHTKDLCPDVPPMRGEEAADAMPRSDADDALDALRDRFIRTRVFAGQLLRLLREANVEIPLAVLEISPDAHTDQ